MSAIFILKKEPPNQQKFFIFNKKPLFRNGSPYLYECWFVLRESCGLSKKCGFVAYFKMLPKLRRFECQK